MCYLFQYTQQFTLIWTVLNDLNPLKTAVMEGKEWYKFNDAHIHLQVPGALPSAKRGLSGTAVCVHRLRLVRRSVVGILSVLLLPVLSLPLYRTHFPTVHVSTPRRQLIHRNAIIVTMHLQWAVEM